MKTREIIGCGETNTRMFVFVFFLINKTIFWSPSLQREWETDERGEKVYEAEGESVKIKRLHRQKQGC